MEDYSVNQKKAIEVNDKNLRIIACAGSGKTSTVAGKVAHLLNPTNGLNIKPKNIIAFTFTEKAAAELKYRVLEGVKTEHKGMADMYVGTIHGWCLRALQENEYEYQKYSVLDEIKQKIFIDKYYDTIGMKDITKLSSPNVSFRRFLDTGLFSKTLDIIRESELTDDLPERVETARLKYEQTLKKHNYFDFTMIIAEAINCLKKGSNLAKNIKENLKYLIVDEYQDINPLQQKLISELQEKSKCKLVVVGDDDQNIYQWRGSNNDYIINFHKRYDETDFESIELSTNYRSSEGITRLAETLISNNQNRLVKEMNSFNNQRYDNKTDIIFNEYDDITEENEAIAHYVKSLIGVSFKDKKSDLKSRGIAYSDIVVLLRTWNKAEAIVETFGKHNIPYVTAGVNQLFETPEIEAAMGLYSYLYEDIDRDELKNLWLCLPYKNSINENDLDKAINKLSQHFPNMENVEKNWAYNLQDFLWEFLENARIFEEAFIDQSVPNSEETAEIIFFNFGKFSRVIQDFEEINFNSTSPSYHLFSFISFVTYAASDYYPEGWLNNSFKTPNAVQIMTIHQAKGLEFPVVVIPGLNKNYLPGKKRGGLGVWHFLEKNLIKDQIRYEGDYENYEDERRLLYVAITRSQKFLLLSRAPDLNNRLYKQPSIFRDELNKSGVLFSNKNETFDSFEKIEPVPKNNTKTINLNFTVLKDFFECPYRFKLISMYGFCFPLNQRMGLGSSFHNCLMEIHKRAKGGEKLSESDLEDIIERQKHFPYIGSSDKLIPKFHEIITRNIGQYYQDNYESFKDIEFVEQEIQLKLEDEILVSGRVDLIKKNKEDGTHETTIIEFKSKEDTQKTKTTEDQLKLYALGHRELTGERADYLMTYIIGDKENKELVKTILKDSDLDEIQEKINSTANQIRNQKFIKLDAKDKCSGCFQNSLCDSIVKYDLKSNR